MPDRRGATGREGEALAADFLAERGYRLCAANWRTRFGELDLIAQDGRTVVFVEVRTRRGDAFGSAAESVGPTKQRRLRLMAEQYLQQHAPNTPARIDVVTVRLTSGRPPVIEHIVGAV